MLFVVCYLLIVVSRCWYLLFVVCCSSFVSCCVSVFEYVLSCVCCYLMFLVCCWLLGGLLLVVSCLRLVASVRLFVVQYLL